MNTIGIGTDIVECLRIAHLIERHGEVFLRRVFTATEIEYCSSRKTATQHYAGRWAGKESVLKAIGTGWTRGIQWTEIEIVNAANGLPQVVLGGAAREYCEDHGIDEVLISISHSRLYATAFATAIGHEVD